MVRAFRQSRLTAVGVFAASAVLAVLVWIRDRELPFYIPLVASVLLLLLGVLLPFTVSHRVLHPPVDQIHRSGQYTSLSDLSD